MSDQTTKRGSNLAEDNSEYDPLAELARIISGQEEDLAKQVEAESEASVETEADISVEAAAEVAVENDPQPEVYIAETSQPIDTDALDKHSNILEPMDLEAELMAGLGVSTANEPEVQAGFEAEAAPETSQSRDGGGSLENQLLEELEIDHSPVAALDAQIPAADMGASGPDDVALDDDLMAVLETELTTEPLNKPDPLAEVEALAAEVAIEAEAPLANDVLAQPPLAAPSIDLADDKPIETGDLGEAFMAEFEQLENAEPEPKIEVPPLIETQLVEERAAEANLEDEFLAGFESELDLEVQGGVPETAAVGASMAKTGSALDDFASEHFTQEPMPVPTASLDDEAFLEDPAVAGLGSDIIEPPKKAGGFRLAATAIGVALVAGLSAVAYGYFTNGSISGPPPTIAADTTPVKQKPETTDTKVAAEDTKAAYEKVEGKVETQTQEKLVSGTEPVKPIVTAKSEERLSAGNDTESAEGEGLTTPRKVRTVTVKPDGTIVRAVEPTPVTPTPVAPKPVVKPVEIASAEVDSKSVDGAKKSGAIAVPAASPRPKPAIRETQDVAFQAPSAAEPVVIKEQAVAAPKPAAAPKPVATPKPVAKPKPAPVVAAPKPAAKPKPAPAPRAEAPIQIASTANSWAVQVSSQRSQADAEASYRNLSRRFPVLGGKPVNIQRANVDGRGIFYRVRIIANSKAAATQLCGRLKSSGGSCFVTR